MTIKAKPGDTLRIIGGDEYVTKSGDIGELATFVDYRNTSFDLYKEYTIKARVISNQTVWSLREQDYEVVNALPTKFKKGQRVKIVKDNFAPEELVGTIGVVDSVSSDGQGAHYEISCVDGECWSFNDEHLEATPDNPVPTGDLDPRVLAYMHAKTLEPDALIDDRIQLAEWLMK